MPLKATQRGVCFVEKGTLEEVSSRMSDLTCIWRKSLKTKQDEEEWRLETGVHYHNIAERLEIPRLDWERPEKENFLASGN